MASPETAEGIILRVRPLRETSLLVNAITESGMRMVLVARGARRPGSHLHGRLQTLSPGRFAFLPGKFEGLPLLVSFQPVSGFSVSTLGVETAALFFYLAELTDRSGVDKESAAAGCFLLSRLLGEARTAGILRPAAVRLWFEVNLLERMGVFPSLEHCSTCRRSFDGLIFYSGRDRGFFCPSCRPVSDACRLSPGSVSILRFVSGGSPERLRRLRVGPVQVAEIGAVTASLIDTLIEKKIESRRFADGVLAGRRT
ncbi:MAG TPA: DNA repair protein RecO [bacterium]|nr:DNA repair protein RecO [bacterium]HPQ65775.1 DNA repair protein RecO [bacterium]